ncbi:MAG: hypothetical protein PVI21_00515 [Candidatus Woesebacteria bacterium]|jgi:hypothetical protein
MFKPVLRSRRSDDLSAMTFVFGRFAYELHLLPEWEVESVSPERVIIVTRRRAGKSMDCFTFRPAPGGSTSTSYWLMPPPFKRVVQRRIERNKNIWRTCCWIVYLVCLLFKKQIIK